MVKTEDIKRPPAAISEALGKIGTAGATGCLHNLGVRNAYICGPVAWTEGKAMAGPALTLQFMPKREDLYGSNEYDDPEKQLHRHALYHTQPGDMIAVDARGEMSAGIFGDMMLTYFKGRGGLGLVIDGCIRDYPNVKHIDLGLWIRGVTPNFHTQTGLMPFAVNVPIACGGVTIMPGDILVADDDGVVCVPAGLAAAVVEAGLKHHEWEEFSRTKLAAGEPLQRYYPLHADARPEYEQWRSANPIK
jgi:regulator of RNase E activity RraA